MLNLELLDICAPALTVGYALGRIGCQLSGDGDYGIRSHLPWAMGYPHGTLPTPPGVTVQPTPIYETVAMGLIAWWLWRNRNRFAAGLLFAAYFVLSGLERLLIEFIRRNHEVFAGLTAAQLESIALIVIGSVWLAAAARRGTLLASGAGGAAAAPA
jgi:phosphatidylglycerol:prolipoprotein diacylglycerol transferase